MAAESTGSRGQRFESGIVEANEATDTSAATELWLAIARLVNDGRARAVVEVEGRREWSATGTMASSSRQSIQRCAATRSQSTRCVPKYISMYFYFNVAGVQLSYYVKSTPCPTPA